MKRTKIAAFLVASVVVVGLVSTGASAGGGGISFVEPSAAPLVFPDGGGVAGIAHADLDLDGHEDLVVTQTTNIAGVGSRGYLSVMLGKGNGSFEVPADIALPTTPVVATGAGVVAVDLVGSAAPDVAVATPQLNAILVYEGMGDGTFGAPETLATPVSPVGLTAGDLDGTGKNDLATYYSATNEAGVLLNGASGFAEEQTLAVGTNPQAIAIADLDSAGGSDLLVGSYDSRSLEAFLNDGGGNFGEALVSDARVQISGLWVGDFDADGANDTVVSGFAPTGEGATCYSNCVQFIKGDGDGTFAVQGNDRIYPVHDYPGLHYSDNIATDLNGDGRPDTIFGHDSINSVTVGYSEAGGALDVTEYVASPGPGYAADYPDSTRPVSVAVADFDEDGRPDIAVGADQTNPRPGGVSILFGGGSAGFESPRSYHLARWSGGPTRGATVADFNNDGDDDVVAITDALDFMPGNGDGTFGVATEALGRISGPGEFYNSIRSADFDQDGNIDVAWAATGGVQGGPGPRNVVAFGNGDGTFGPSPVFLAPRVSDWGGRNLVAEDLNSDGYPDLAVLTKALYGEAAEIDLYLYNPDAPGTFTAGAVLDLGGTNTYPGYGMAAADVNADGFIDLITHIAVGGSSAGEQLFVFRGNGDGTFATALITSPGLPDVQDLAGADVDGDGKIDLIGAGSNQVDVLRGAGDGTFSDRETYAAGISAGFVRPVDLDGDGVLDLAVGHQGCTCSNGFGILPGQGDGTFGDYTGFAVGSGTLMSMDVEDLTGDGKADVVAGRGGSVAQITVLLNESVAVAQTHDRSVSLKLKGRTAKGTVSVDDGTTACIDNVTVAIQRKAGGKWKSVDKIRTKASSGDSSTFKTTIPDKKGSYRAKVSKLTLDNSSVCSAATSPTRKYP